MQRPNVNGPHVCSFCTKSYDTLQALGGHMTCHRDEMEQMRSQHEAFMRSHRAKSRDIVDHVSSFRERRKSPERVIDKAVATIPFVPLTPNTAYWQNYRRYGLQPWVINFLHVEKDFSSDKTTFRMPARQLNKMHRGEGSRSKVLDLTLKL